MIVKTQKLKFNVNGLWHVLDLLLTVIGDILKELHKNLVTFDPFVLSVWIAN